MWVAVVGAGSFDGVCGECVAAGEWVGLEEWRLEDREGPGSVLESCC